MIPHASGAGQGRAGLANCFTDQRRSDHCDSAGERPQPSLRTPRGVVDDPQPQFGSVDGAAHSRSDDPNQTPAQRTDSPRTRHRSGAMQFVGDHPL